MAKLKGVTKEMGAWASKTRIVTKHSGSKKPTNVKRRKRPRR